MSMFDQLLGKATDHPTVKNMADKIGIDPEQAAKAVAALSESHQQEGDTIELASQKTGLDAGTLGQIRDHIGGEGSLERFATMLDRDGDGNPFDDLADMAKGLFGKK